MIVYVDILLLINLYIDYLIIKISLMLLHRKVKTYRIIIASAFASFTSLIIFLPQNFILELTAKFLTALIIAVIISGFKDNLKLYFVLLIVSAIFNGLFLLLGNTIFEKTIKTVNGQTYFDISLLTFGVYTTIIYVILSLISRIFNVVPQEKFKISIFCENDKITYDGVCDSGNKLTDYLTGKPIIICPNSKIAKQMKFLRFVPYNTIDSNGLIKLVKATDIKIEFENGKCITPNALIGINENSENEIAIINPSVIM